MDGTITITDRAGAKIHTYTCPEQGLLVNTHLIELPTQTLAVDAQFALPYAREVVEYGATLGKPISRLYVTHEHPDHFFGAEVFGVPVYALEEVKRTIETQGEAMVAQNHARFGDIVPSRPTNPTRVIRPGEETLDGVRLLFRKVERTEAAVLLTVALPDQSVIITQDLVYNNVHLFIAARTLDTWATVVREYQQMPYDTVLPGHGLPGSRTVYDQVLDYLAGAKSALAESETGEALKRNLIQRFPEYGGRALLDIQNSYLFPHEAES